MKLQLLLGITLLMTCTHLSTGQSPEITSVDSEDEVTGTTENATEVSDDATSEEASTTSEPSTTPEEEEVFVCPQPFGYYSHANCWQFWQCSNGDAYEMTCADGTQWEQALNTCNHLTTCSRP